MNDPSKEEESIKKIIEATRELVACYKRKISLVETRGLFFVFENETYKTDRHHGGRSVNTVRNISKIIKHFFRK